MPGITFDKERFSINIARIKKGGDVFEIPIDADLAIEFRKGRSVEIRDVLKSEHVFSDAKKGLRASEHLMQQVFGASDPLKVAEIILKEGEIQLTAEHREKMREEKKKRIMDIIHRNGVDPRTDAPHPITRIENAFEQAKIRIDEMRSAEEQVDDVLKQLRPIMPIRFEIKEIQVHIPAIHAAKSYSAVKHFSKMLKEEWMNDGSLLAVVELPGGLEQEFYDKLNKATHGDAECKVIKTK